MSDLDKTDNAGRACPKCHSTNLQTEPIYDWDDGLTDEIGLYCVTCGHYLGEFPSNLQTKGASFHSHLLAQLGQHSQESYSGEVQEILLGRKAATPDFD